MSTTMKARREYTPSSADISRMAAQIRKEWTPEVRAARRRMARVYQSQLLSSNNRFAA